MRRIILAFMSTVAAVVMLFGYRTSTPAPAAASTVAVASGTGGSTASATGGASSAASPGASAPATTTKTVNGAVANTRWGPVQVQIKVVGRTVTAVSLLQVPSGNSKDVEINNYAVPVLTQEALRAQSAKIDSVSGATYTSQGYMSSLQSALDAAGL